MKILVLSDSHGGYPNMKEAFLREKPDRVFFLGDGLRDIERLESDFPDTPVDKVPGNCDLGSDLEPEQERFLGGCRMFLCHGHRHGVKFSLLQAGYTAEERDLDLFLFGHTHRPLVDRRGKCWFVNPGSIGNKVNPFYAVVTAQNGELEAHTVPLWG